MIANGACISEKSTKTIFSSELRISSIIGTIVRSVVAGADSDGNTALHYAAKGGHLEVVQWLVKEGGASIADKNDNGQTAFDLANEPKIKEFLKRFCSSQHYSSNPSILFNNQSSKPAPQPSQNKNTGSRLNN